MLSDTRDKAYSELHKCSRLSETQSRVYNYICANKQATRQEISLEEGLTINCVCGRVDELKSLGLIMEDGECNGRGLLRIMLDGEHIKKPDCLSHTKLQILIKKLLELKEIGTEFQLKEIKDLVARL